MALVISGLLCVFSPRCCCCCFFGRHRAVRSISTFHTMHVKRGRREKGREVDLLFVVLKSCFGAFPAAYLIILARTNVLRPLGLPPLLVRLCRTLYGDEQHDCGGELSGVHQWTALPGERRGRGSVDCEPARRQVRVHGKTLAGELANEESDSWRCFGLHSSLG